MTATAQQGFTLWLTGLPSAGKSTLARGEVKAWTGVSDPYEPPAAPELHLHTDQLDVDAAVARILEHVRDRRLAAVPAI